MIRENRYFVLKFKDLAQYPPEVIEQVYTQLNHLSSLLPDRSYVVVEDDWPEYEKVWKMIEERVDGETPSST